MYKYHLHIILLFIIINFEKKRSLILYMIVIVTFRQYSSKRFKFYFRRLIWRGKLIFLSDWLVTSILDIQCK